MAGSIIVGGALAEERRQVSNLKNVRNFFSTCTDDRPAVVDRQLWRTAISDIFLNLRDCITV